MSSEKLHEETGRGGVVAFAVRFRRMLLPLLYVGSAIRHMGWLSRFWNAPKGSLLEKLIISRPEVWQMLRVRFVSSAWTASERFAHIHDHCNLVEKMGLPFSIRPNEYVELLDLEEVGPGCKLTLDSPRWLLREGLLSLNITQDRDRIFSLAFTFAWEGKKLIAYVGGIQGRRGPDMLERYRQFTKAAHGTRPQDLIVEIFRLLCNEMGVMRILCVSDRIRNGRTPLEPHRTDFIDQVTFDYDALWQARGGVLRADGFYELVVPAPIRKLSDVPANRRAQRRRRNAMMASIRSRLATVLRNPKGIVVGQHEPNFP